MAAPRLNGHTAAESALIDVLAEIPAPEAFDAMTPKDAALLVARAEAFAGMLASQGERLLERLDDLKESLALRMDGLVLPTIRIDGVTVTQMIGHTVEPEFTDLLPEGVLPDDPRYATTVENAREAGRMRLLHRLEATSRGHLVLTVHDEQGLTELIAGDDAPTDAHGDPVVPADLAGYVKVRPVRTVLIKSEE